MSPKLSIDFYIDASTPISGFLSPAGVGKNHFRDLLFHANGLFTGPWPDATARYWSFGGGTPKEVKDDDHMMSFNLHPERFKELETNIDQPINHIPPMVDGREELKVIVTDLFQQDDDVVNLATKLNNAYLQYPDKAVAVIAIRNPYKHKIYDLPDHKILPESAADSLPFYILLCGKLADVQHASDLIVSQLKVDQQSGASLSVLFSSHTIADLEQRLGDPAEGDQYTIYSNKVPGSRDRGIPYVAAKRGKTLNINFPSFPGADVKKALSNPVFAKIPTIKPTFKVWNAAHKAYDEVDGADAFKFDFASKTLQVVTAQLAPKSVYLVRLDLHPTQGEWDDLGDWSFENEDLNKILVQGFDQTKGGGKAGKTLNLQPFLKTMSYKIFPPKGLKDQGSNALATYYLYLEVN